MLTLTPYLHIPVWYGLNLEKIKKMLFNSSIFHGLNIYTCPEQREIHNHMYLHQGNQQQQIECDKFMVNLGVLIELLEMRFFCRSYSHRMKNLPGNLLS